MAAVVEDNIRVDHRIDMARTGGTMEIGPTFHIFFYCPNTDERQHGCMTTPYTRHNQQPRLGSGTSRSYMMAAAYLLSAVQLKARRLTRAENATNPLEPKRLSYTCIYV